jgi:hypothetical protein
MKLVGVLLPQPPLNAPRLLLIDEEPVGGEIARRERLVEAPAVEQRANGSLVFNEVERRGKGAF